MADWAEMERVRQEVRMQLELDANALRVTEVAASVPSRVSTHLMSKDVTFLRPKGKKGPFATRKPIAKHFK